MGNIAARNMLYMMQDINVVHLFLTEQNLQSTFIRISLTFTTFQSMRILRQLSHYISRQQRDCIFMILGPLLICFRDESCNYVFIPLSYQPNSQFLIRQYMEDGQLSELLDELLNSASSSSWSARHGSVLVISSMLRHNPSLLCASPKFSIVVHFLKESLKDDKVLPSFRNVILFC